MPAGDSTPGTSRRLHGKVALITGAASGIGWATARLFAENGAAVVLADVDAPKLEECCHLIRGLSEDCLALLLDVTKETEWHDSIQRVINSWSHLDILVNCAGISDDASLTELSLHQWRRVMAVNLDGVFLGTAAAIRAMASRRVGSIINISSLSGIKASPGASAYCTSKAAVIHFSRVAALECANAGHNIRVNCLVPGGVKTPMWEKTPLWPDISTTPEWTAPPNAPALRRFAKPEEIAQAILFLASDESSYVSGAALVVDGGASA